MLDGKDKVYFFTDHISHATYGKFIPASNEPSGCLQTFGDCREGQIPRCSAALSLIAEVRERKIPFGYLGSLNTEKLIRQVYEDLYAEG